jgi:adenylylsulfate kinase
MKKKKSGIVFWITGLSGSGKSTIGNIIFNDINKKYGKTLIIHGDDIRNIYDFKQYEKKDRLKLGKSNSNLCKLIADQGLNVIFTTVGLFHKVQEYNRSNIKNYLEIYIKCDLKNLLKMKKKIFYRKKTKFVWGLDIKAEFPKKPDILLQNNFDVPMQKLGMILLKTIKKKLNPVK